MADQPPPEQPPGKFTDEIQKLQAPPASGLDKAINMLNNVSRRLRILEDRYSNLRRKTQITDQNMLANSKRLTQKIKLITEDIKEAKKDIYSMKEKLSLFVKELDTCARSEDVKLIDKYVNLWSPINFVTQAEARNLVRQMIKDVLEGQSETFNNAVEPNSAEKEVEENRS